MRSLAKRYDALFWRFLPEGKNQHRKINVGGGINPLVVEAIGDNHVSFAQYGEQNGDLMRDPEVVFHVAHGGVFPVYYRNDWVGVEDDYERVPNDRKQKDLSIFCEEWLETLGHLMAENGGNPYAREMAIFPQDDPETIF